MGLLVTAVGFGQTTYSEPNAITNNPSGTGGSNNLHLGVGAANLSTTSYNVYLGFETAKNKNDGEYNTFIGYRAGFRNIGSTNCFVGAEAGADSNGERNTYVGRNSGYRNIGVENVIIGWGTGDGNKDTNTNAYLTKSVVVGRGSASGSSGTQNIILGHLSGTFINGNGNIIIGNGIFQASQNQGSTQITNVSKKLYIDESSKDNPLIYGDFTNNSEQLKFNAYKVGIGPEFGDFPALTGLTNADKYRLFVRGGILAEEVRIRLQNNWPDYVFAKDYKLLSLKDTEKYIAENGHLPNMPSAEKVKAEGVELGNIVTLQQEKIEELTLHLIEQQKQIEELQKQVQLLLNK